MPDSLDPTGDLPSFPVDVLPSWLGDYVRELSRWIETPPGLAGMLSLAVVATAAAKRVRLEVRAGYHEPLNLYSMVVMGPGTRKSPVLKTLIAPLIEREQELIERARPAIAEAQAQRVTVEKRLKRAQDKAARVSDPEASREAAEEVARLARELETAEVPDSPALLVGDVTPEALVLKLAQSGGRLASLSAEGGIFGTLGGRYSQGLPNLDAVLQAWGGDLIKVDRMGRAPLCIASPALTLGLAVQPDVLNSAMEVPGMTGRGLLARFLYAVPRSTVGRRTFDTAPIPAKVIEGYAAGLGQLLELRGPEQHDDSAGRLLTLTPAAAESWRCFAAGFDPRIAEGGDLAVLLHWGSKLPGNIARVAGLLHLAEHAHRGDPLGERVSRETMQRALRLAEYLIPHALTALDAAGADPVRAGARHLLGWLRRRRTPEVSRRALHQGNRSVFPRIADLDPAIALLLETGWLRHRNARATRGRPSPGYLLHPSLLSSQSPQNPQIRQGGGGCE